MKPNLENLPRTISVFRAKSEKSSIPDSLPVVSILDQTLLPDKEEFLEIRDWRQVVDCIKSLVVRGAPAIGIAGAAAILLRLAEFAYCESDAFPCREGCGADGETGFGIDVVCKPMETFDQRSFLEAMQLAAEDVKASRPTAVNLAWAVDSCMGLVRENIASGVDVRTVEEILYERVCQMIADDEEANRKIGRIGASLLPDNARLLTHCNAGSLATAFFGTALGVVYTAAEGRGVEMVYADETRPIGQGRRLTSWELSKAGVPVTLICDDMAASVMAACNVDAVVVGADRIAANGDVANKIGTLGVAIIANHFGIPFYVAAPTSTIDIAMENGKQIPIEQRDGSEVLDKPIEGVEILNPAFDVTPSSLVTKIITESGAFDPDDILDALKN